jgi:hypothetical protein
VPQNKDLKRLVRARMTETGERYTEALGAILGQAGLEPLPAPWFMAGRRPDDYEVGLLPASLSHDGHRVVQLRSRVSASGGRGDFGTLMQSFTAANYLGRRVRFSATVRTLEVTGWSGLWMRVDGRGARAFDNMQDRRLRGTTGWTRADVVLDVHTRAESIHFGVLLDGTGAAELCQARFEQVDDSVPVTGGLLPDGPRALDFTAT